MTEKGRIGKRDYLKIKCSYFLQDCDCQFCRMSLTENNLFEDEMKIKENAVKVLILFSFSSEFISIYLHSVRHKKINHSRANPTTRCVALLQQA